MPSTYKLNQIAISLSFLGKIKKIIYIKSIYKKHLLQKRKNEKEKLMKKNLML